MMIIVAVYSFSLPAKLRALDSTGESVQAKKYEAFVTGVLSGGTQGRPDQYVDAMRVQGIITKNARARSASVLEFLSDVGWMAVYGIVTQLIAIYYIHRRLGEARRLIGR
jgi:hypothetical protein